jgi:hypothetical protein
LYQLDLEMEKKVKEKKAKKGIIVKSKEEKRALKRLKEKEKKMKKKRRLRKLLDRDEGVKEFDDFKDNVQFNEIVHAPPSLKKLGNQTKPKYSNLLLSKKLPQSGSEVSAAKQKILDEERLRVIEEYRKIKGSKLNKVKL